MHSRPTALELLRAVQDHLRERVIPRLEDPQLRYHTLVAVHVLRIVERELEQGDTALQEEWSSLCALLGDQRPSPRNASQTAAETGELSTHLAEQILSGARDDDHSVLPVLQQRVSAKLDVSNPEFRR